MKRRDILLSASSLATAAVVANVRLSDAKEPATKTNLPGTNPAVKMGQNIQITQDLPGYYVTPAGAGKFPAVIVLMEAFGLNQWCRSICDRLAQAGFVATARGKCRSRACRRRNRRRTVDGDGLWRFAAGRRG